MIPYSVFSKFDNVPSNYFVADMPISTTNEYYKMCTAVSVFDNNSYLWLADRNKVVRKFQYATDEIAIQIPQYPEIRSIAVGSSGSLYISSYTDNLEFLVSKINRLGMLEWTRKISLAGAWFTTSYANTKSLIVDSSENIYVLIDAYYGGAIPLVVKMSSSGSLLWSKSINMAGSFSEVRQFAMTLNSSGNLVIAIAGGYKVTTYDMGFPIDSQRNSMLLVLMSSSGGIVSSLQHDISGFTTFEVHDIASNANGDISVLLRNDYIGNRLVRYSSGSFSWVKSLGTTSSSTAAYTSIALDSSGNTYAATGNNGSYGIVKINPAGASVLNIDLSAPQGTNSLSILTTSNSLVALDSKYVLSLESDSSVYGKSISFRGNLISTSSSSSLTVGSVTATANTRYSISSSDFSVDVSSVTTYTSSKLLVSSIRQYR